MLFQAICRTGIFMICAQALIHFRPKEAYEKYLKLLVSVMVLIQVFLPVGSLLLGKGGQKAAQTLEQFSRELEQGMEDAKESAAAADALLEKMTLEEVRRRLEAQEGREDAEAQAPQGEGSQEESADEAAGTGSEEIRIEADSIEQIVIEFGNP